MKELFHKFVKRNRTIVVDDANLAMTATAIYETIGRNGDKVEFEPVWRIGGPEWLLRFNASGSQVDEIKRRLRGK